MMGLAKPFGGAADQRSSDTATMPAIDDVEIVDIRAPDCIMVGERTDEPDNLGALLRDAHVLVRGWRRQAIVPDHTSVFERAAIKELVGHHSSVRPPPAFSMERRNAFGIADM